MALSSYVARSRAIVSLALHRFVRPQFVIHESLVCCAVQGVGVGMLRGAGDSRT